MLTLLNRDALAYLCDAKEEWLSYVDVARLALTCRVLATRLDPIEQRRIRHERERVVIDHIARTISAAERAEFSTRHISVETWHYFGTRNVAITYKARTTTACIDALEQPIYVHGGTVVCRVYSKGIKSTQVWNLKEAAKAKRAIHDVLQLALNEHMRTVRLDRRASTLVRMKRRVDGLCNMGGCRRDDENG